MKVSTELHVSAIPGTDLRAWRCTQMNAQVSQLSLYDIAGTPGVAADVSHINTKAQVKVSNLDVCDEFPVGGSSAGPRSTRFLSQLLLLHALRRATTRMVLPRRCAVATWSLSRPVFPASPA